MQQLLSHIGLGYLLWSEKLGVLLSSIVWTCDVTCNWEMLSWGEGGFRDSSQGCLPSRTYNIYAVA